MTKEGHKRSTIRSVAAYLQLSPTTVSLALRGDGSIPPETRNRVLIAARELNYTYISRSKDVQNRKALRRLVYVVKDYGDQPVLANPFYGHILSGVEEICQEKDAKLGLLVMPHDYPDETELPAALTREVDGIIMSSPYPQKVIHRVAKTSGCPIVLVDNSFPGSPYDTIMADDYGGAYQATRYLIELGHTQVKTIMGQALSPLIPPSFRERYRGYCAACEEAGISPLPPAIMPPEADKSPSDKIEGFHNWFAHLLEESPGLTAFFGVNDPYAINAIYTLQRLGYRVPEDMSVVGFDDNYLSSLIQPPLTTVHSYKRTLGTLAVTQLLTRLSGNTMPPISVTVGTDLIVRGSAGAIRSGRNGG